MLARPQSTWSCSLNRTSIARCSFCQTPLASHTPTVAQNLGISSKETPVCCTNRMPSRTDSSHTESLHIPLLAQVRRLVLGLQPSPQFFVNRLSCHEGMKHQRFKLASKRMALSSLPCPLRDDFAHPLGFAVFAWQHSASRLLDCQDSSFY